MKRIILSLSILFVCKLSIGQEKFLYYKYHDAIIMFEYNGKTQQIERDISVNYEYDDMSSVANIRALKHPNGYFVVLGTPEFGTTKNNTIIFTCKVIDEKKRILDCVLSIDIKDTRYYSLSVINDEGNVLMFMFNRYVHGDGYYLN